MGQNEAKRYQSRQPAGTLRIDQGDLKTLGPSIPAVEFWMYLGEKDEFLARMLWASRPFNFQKTEEDQARARNCGVERA